MSRLAVLALAGAAVLAGNGCAKDVCGGVSGACVALHIESSSSQLTDVDQLTISGSGLVTVDPLRTPATPKKMSLPIDVAIGFHQQATGNESINVIAFLSGSAVGSGATSVDVAAGKHVSINVVLTPGGVAGDDLGVDDGDGGGELDLGPADLTGVVAKHQGDACTPSDVCDTGHCVDGICCNSACGESCNACNLTGLVGTCSPIPDGNSPVHGVCATQTPSTCGLNGACDGAGACAKYPQGTLCGASSCDSTTNKFTPASKCDGAGTCQLLAMQDCAPYKCKDTTQCYGPPCGSTSECSGSNTCVGGSCGLLSDGRNCTANNQCLHNSCIDGVCCNAACSGQCQACDIPDGSGNLGVCQTVASGPPHGTRTACTGTGTTCGGSCKGTPTACTYTAATTKCNSSCKSTTTETDFYCSGAGACSATGTDLACTGGYICSSNLCLSTCSTSSQCQSPPYVCKSSACTLCGNGVKDGGETDVDCGGATCTTKCAPNKTCTSGTDCVTGSCVSGLCTLVSNLPKWLTLANMPDYRTEPAVGLYNPQQIYLMGGAQVSSNKYIATNVIDIYNIPTNSWTTSAAGVSYTAMAGDGQGGYGTFSFGGHDTDMFEDSNLTYLYPGPVAKTNMPTERSYAASAYSWTDFHHYVIGGAPYSNGVACLTTSEAYQGGTNLWTTGVSPVHGRCGLGIATDPSNGRIYIFGGEGHFEQHDIQGTIEYWKSGDSSWTQVTATMPRPRSYVAGGMGADGRVWVMGGEDGTIGASNYVDAYNPATGRWDAVAQLNVSRTRAGATVGPDGRLYVFGGQQPPSGPVAADTLNSAEAYGPIFTLSPTHAQAGATITVSGSNFAASANVSINWMNNGTATLLKTTTSNATGVMTTTTFTVPTGYGSGGFNVQLVDDKSQYPVIFTFGLDP